MFIESRKKKNCKFYKVSRDYELGISYLYKQQRKFFYIFFYLFIFLFFYFSIFLYLCFSHNRNQHNHFALQLSKLMKDINNSYINVYTPTELSDKFMHELAFHKGRVIFEDLCQFIKDNMKLNVSVIDDSLYLNFLVRTLISNQDILIKDSSGDVFVDKLQFLGKFDIASILKSNEIDKTLKLYSFALTDGKLFEALTGENISVRNTLGDKAFELLVEIASWKKEGVDRITLCKICDQDPRSIPSRIKRIESYITSVNCLKQSRPTQQFWHKNYSENIKTEVHLLNTRTIERMAIMEKVKNAPECIREVSDLKEELGISTSHNEAKVFRMNYFWLSKHSYLERILVKSSHNGKIYYCLKFLKDFLPEELSTDDIDDMDDDNSIFTDVISPEVESSVSEVPYFETSILDGLSECNESLFSNSLFDNELIIRSIVENSASNGTTTMEILPDLFSSDFIKPLQKFMSQMVKDPVKSESALENSPFQMVKVYDFEGKVKHYRVFSYRNYESKYGVEGDIMKAVEVEDLNVCSFSQDSIVAQIKKVPFPKGLEYYELHNGQQAYCWINDMSPSNKKALEELSTSDIVTAVKKQKKSMEIILPTKTVSNVKEEPIHKTSFDESLQKIKIENVEKIKPFKSNRLKNLSTVTSSSIKSRSFGDFVGYSIRSIRTQQAILELVKENNGLLCYFDKVVAEKIRAKMKLSYFIDRKVLKRDIINLLQVKKIKTFKFDDQLYLTSPAISSEQVQYFHKNKLKGIKDRMEIADKIAVSQRNVESLKGTNNIDLDDLAKNKHLINNAFITTGIKCLVKPSLYFSSSSKQQRFVKQIVKQADAESKEPKIKVSRASKGRSSVKAKNTTRRHKRNEESVKTHQSFKKQPITEHIDEQLHEIAQQTLNTNELDTNEDMNVESDAAVTSYEQQLEKDVLKTNITLFIRCCLVSRLLENDINWDVIGKLFRRSSRKVKDIFTTELIKHRGNGWLTSELKNCRYYISENIKSKKLDIADIENIEYVKIAKVWLDSEYETAQNALSLIEDGQEFKRLFALKGDRSNANLYFSEKSYFKTSLIKRYKGLLRKKYCTSIFKTSKDSVAYTAIKSAIKSILLDQKGKNNKHHKINFDILSTYIKKYSDEELNLVLKDLSQKKIILMKNNGIQLNDLILDSFTKLDQTLFFQGFKKNSDLIKGLLLEKKMPIFEDEVEKELSGFIFDRCDSNYLELVNLSGKYRADLKKDTSYSTKDDETLNSQMLIVSRYPEKLAKKSLPSLNDVPGLGIPYSNIWIDGNGDIRQSMWKVCLSHICLYLYLRPESTLDTISLSFKEFLDVAEIKNILEWLRQNQIISKDEVSQTETIDLQVACLLF